MLLLLLLFQINHHLHPLLILIWLLFVFPFLLLFVEKVEQIHVLIQYQNQFLLFHHQWLEVEELGLIVEERRSDEEKEEDSGAVELKQSLFLNLYLYLFLYPYLYPLFLSLCPYPLAFSLFPRIFHHQNLRFQCHHPIISDYEMEEKKKIMMMMMMNYYFLYY